MVAFIVIAVVLFAAVGGVSYYFWKKAHPTYAGPPAIYLAKAIPLIWARVYGQNMSKLPVIQWMTGSQLNAKNGTCWVDAWGRAVAGLTNDAGTFCQIAWVKGELLSDCALAHELCHAYLTLTGQDPDPNHTGPAYAPGGIKDQANDALRSIGL